ncbi:hypothetical protein [Amycolatopsis sp. NPDC051128]|jgi:hypothetical protein|uniref:hypothetical protein n=1 Tax=Amycolatopsis sp. NPDC051128 TaxID=3155412 RepID=UPI003423FF19
MAMSSTELMLARQLGVHEFLTGRGWQVDGGSDPGDLAFAEDPHSGWHYPASYGGRHVNTVSDTTPVPLQSYFTYDRDGDEVFGVVPAGNLRGSGCAEHDTREQFFAFTADGAVDLDRLAPLLDVLEPRARALDPRALIECLYFGPCGS